MDNSDSSARWTQAGSLLGLIGVGAGAFGAHALEDLVSPERVAVWETASRYAMYHALALVAVGLRAQSVDSPHLHRAGMAFLAGAVLFSGTLFALVILDLPILGAVTPLGGLSLMVGWVLLFLSGRARPAG